MSNTYKKNLLNELRLFVISNKEVAMTDENLCKAITLNENLKSLGFQLKPKDIVCVAKNESLDSFWDEFQNLIVTEIKAKPMYPNYPNQVMKISEAQFRLHQICHYFSTYGLEDLFGVEVKQGWLPDVEDTEKTETESALIPAKTIGLITETEMFIVPAKRILAKRERMSIPETEIVLKAVKNLSKDELASLKVSFKENLIEIFHQVMESSMDSETKVNVLHALCQHTGDVWKCLEFYIGKYKRYKLSTSEKKTIVKLFESYPVEDFRANLIISNKNARRIITLLEFLSYNRFSRNEGHKKAVSDLRNNNLKSWNSTARYLIDNQDNKTISFIGKHPGIHLRMVNELVSKGFNPEEIKVTLIENASHLATQTLVNALTFFELENDERNQKVVAKVKDIFYAVLRAKMASMDTPLKNKKIFLDPGMISLADSVFDKSEEGGYIRSGMAVRIPEHIQNLRFFCYWNDKRRIDIDLHAYGQTVNGTYLHIGWNSDFRRRGANGVCDAVFSGDITHSNAAEFIDINMNSEEIDFVSFDISSFTRVPFAKIDTVYTGLMAVNSRGENVKLYDAKNCLFTHELRGESTDIHYGRIDVPRRLLIIEAQNARRNLAGGSRDKTAISNFTMKTYLDLLFEIQNVELVEEAEDAEIILTLTKPEVENGISLIDENFFMEN